jgi:hypothetical protein
MLLLLSLYVLYYCVTVALTTLPFGSDKSPAEALKQVREFREKLVAARQYEASLRPGLGIFDIPTPEYAEVCMFVFTEPHQLCMGLYVVRLRNRCCTVML